MYRYTFFIFINLPQFHITFRLFTKLAAAYKGLRSKTAAANLPE
jgi:hypothetical protein